MTNQTVKAAQESVQKSEAFDIRYFLWGVFLRLLHRWEIERESLSHVFGWDKINANVSHWHQSTSARKTKHSTTCSVMFYLVLLKLVMTMLLLVIWLFFSWSLYILYNLLYRRNPISIAAAIIYIVTQLSDDKKPLKGTPSIT